MLSYSIKKNFYLSRYMIIGKKSQCTRKVNTEEAIIDLVDNIYKCNLHMNWIFEHVG